MKKFLLITLSALMMLGVYTPAFALTAQPGDHVITNAETGETVVIPKTDAAVSDTANEPATNNAPNDPIAEELPKTGGTGAPIPRPTTPPRPMYTYAAPPHSYYSEGVRPVMFDNNQDGNFSNDSTNYGYVNSLGESAFYTRFSFANNFSDGLAAVKFADGTMGYIDHTGHKAFELTFNNVGPFREGLAYVLLENGNYGYIDRTGQKAIDAEFKTAFTFSEGVAGVRLFDDNWIYIDHNGEQAIDGNFQYAPSFHEGLAAVVFDDGTRGYIDRTGATAFSQKFKSADSFRTGLARVCFEDGSYGFIDRSGKNAFGTATFQYVTSFGSKNYTFVRFHNGDEGTIYINGHIRTRTSASELPQLLNTATVGN